jgi:hypothetical protein
MVGRWAAALSLAALAACSAPGSGDEGRPGPGGGPPRQATVGGVRYSAETRIAETAPVTVYATARAENTSSARRAVRFPDGCVVLLRAYRDPARTGAPAWDQGRGVACTMMLVEVSLGPGESREFLASARADQILGDSLPAGTYYFTAVLRPDGQRVEVAAGEAELAR